MIGGAQDGVVIPDYQCIASASKYEQGDIQARAMNAESDGETRDRIAAL
jgi:hypothetical protein